MSCGVSEDDSTYAVDEPVPVFAATGSLWRTCRSVRLSQVDLRGSMLTFSQTITSARNLRWHRLLLTFLDLVELFRVHPEHRHRATRHSPHANWGHRSGVLFVQLFDQTISLRQHVSIHDARRIMLVHPRSVDQLVNDDHFLLVCRRALDVTRQKHAGEKNLQGMAIFQFGRVAVQFIRFELGTGSKSIAVVRVRHLGRQRQNDDHIRRMFIFSSNKFHAETQAIECLDTLVDGGIPCSGLIEDS